MEGGVQASLEQEVPLIASEGGEFQLDIKGQGLSGSNLNSKGSTGKSKKKKRAQRATKAEMERRRRIVAEIFFFSGDLTPKDLNPLVDEALGEHMEPHHLRAVLRRFNETFEVRPQHGLWGLTAQGKDEFALLFGKAEPQDSNIVAAQLSDVILLPS